MWSFREDRRSRSTPTKTFLYNATKQRVMNDPEDYDDMMSRVEDMGTPVDTLGFWDWLLHRKPKPKATTNIERYNAARRKYARLLTQLRQVRAEMNALRSRMGGMEPIRRFAHRATVAATSQGLTPGEIAELNRRMKWGWAQRPGAPDMPGEAAAKRANYSKYRADLAKRIRADIIRRRYR